MSNRKPAIARREAVIRYELEYGGTDTEAEITEQLRRLIGERGRATAEEVCERLGVLEHYPNAMHFAKVFHAAGK